MGASKPAGTRGADVRSPLCFGSLRPWLAAAVSALFAARPLFPSESAAQGDGQVMVMLWVALAVAWLAALTAAIFRRGKGAEADRRRSIVRWGWTETTVAALVGWHTLAAVWAFAHGSPRPAINMLWEWVALGLSFFLARQLVTGRREARAAVAVMIGLGAALAGYGLYQYAVELPATRAMYQADSEQALRDAGLWYPAGSPERQLLEKRLESVEPLSTFALTNSLAGFLAPWLIVAMGIGVVGVGRDRRAAVLTWSAIAVATLLMGACLLLTKSRGGYLAAILGALLVGGAGLRHRVQGRIGCKALATGAAALVLVAVGVVATRSVGGLDAEVLTEATKSLGYRVQYWQSSLRMIAGHPWLGVGPGNFQDTYPQYKLAEASEEIADPHNFLLEVWATAGTPAALAMLAVLGSFAFTLLWRRKMGSEDASGSSGPADQCTRHTPCAEASSTRNVPSTERDRPALVLAGGAVGFLLSLPIGMLGSAPPGIFVYVIGLPLSVGVVAALWPWIDSGRLPAMLTAIGAAVLLANLLVAGGIGFSSVSGTLWLLMALGLNAVEPDPKDWTASRIASSLALPALLAVALACYLTGYRPVVQSQRWMRMAAWEPARRLEHLAGAAAADPWAAAPREGLAAEYFDAWQTTRSGEAIVAFERMKDEALRLKPGSAAARHDFGRLYQKAYQETGSSVYLDKAVAEYRSAVERYPTNAPYRADLAEALRAAGDESGFQREKAEAIRLDRLTPHEDRKLPAEQRKRLERNELANP